LLLSLARQVLVLGRILIRHCQNIGNRVTLNTLSLPERYAG
jgi:hypothetical protein